MLGPDSTIDDARKTIQTFYAMLKQWKQDIDSRQSTYHWLSLLEKEWKGHELTISKQADKLKSQASKIEQLTSQVRHLESQHKKERKQLEWEKEDSIKQVMASTHWVNQMIHEVKKKEAENGKLKA